MDSREPAPVTNATLPRNGSIRLAGVDAAIGTRIITALCCVVCLYVCATNRMCCRCALPSAMLEYVLDV
jgi:hypothetical protein